MLIIIHKDLLKSFFAREEIDTMYCYVIQDKFWVTDPDGKVREFFYTKSDSEVYTIESIK